MKVDVINPPRDLGRTSVMHVVSKSDPSNHLSFSLDEDELPALKESSVRVRPKILAITFNNLAYARFGSMLRWWDTFPVPEFAPSPYNDRSGWGLVPAWGYGEVIESSVGSLPRGSVLYGFWPSSAFPVDLKLVEAVPEGHWVETSQHRSQQLTSYNRYIDTSSIEATTSDDVKGWTSIYRPLWECSYVLNRYTFPDRPFRALKSAVHPMGMGAPWSNEDADLRRTVVVSMSAASKTGRAFHWQIKRNRNAAEHGPLALVEAATFAHELSHVGEDECNVPIKAISYDDLTKDESIEWIAALKPTRVVVVDFGTANENVERLKSALESAQGFETTPSFVFIGIGAMAKALSPDAMRQVMAKQQKMGKLQCITSTVKDRAIEAEGAEEYSRSANESFERFLREHNDGSLKLGWGKGVQGAAGLEGCWTKLYDGTVSRNEAHVFHL